MLLPTEKAKEFLTHGNIISAEDAERYISFIELGVEIKVIGLFPVQKEMYQTVTITKYPEDLHYYLMKFYDLVESKGGIQ